MSKKNQCFHLFMVALDLILFKLADEPRHEKTNILLSDLVQQKPGCTATEDGWRLEISDLESRGIILSM